uniref:uncharacterized protein LOC118526968 n=1 Tax=Halichoerus grypus TaxID=9711 RepID=UPI001659F6B5|nr:uncharacterized protein LOC118526968 [Halichoerus grypus]
MEAPVKMGMQVEALPPDSAGAKTRLFWILGWGALSPRAGLLFSHRSSTGGNSAKALRSTREMGVLLSPPLTGEGTEALTGPTAVSWEVELGGRPQDSELPHRTPPAAGRFQTVEADDEVRHILVSGFLAHRSTSWDAADEVISQGADGKKPWLCLLVLPPGPSEDSSCVRNATLELLSVSQNCNRQVAAAAGQTLGRAEECSRRPEAGEPGISRTLPLRGTGAPALSPGHHCSGLPAAPCIFPCPWALSAHRRHPYINSSWRALLCLCLALLRLPFPRREGPSSQSRSPMTWPTLPLSPLRIPPPLRNFTLLENRLQLDSGGSWQTPPQPVLKLRCNHEEATDILQRNWPLLFKRAKVVKDKACQKSCPRRGDPGRQDDQVRYRAWTGR